MEGEINAWLAQNREKVEKLDMKIKDIHKDFVSLKVRGYRIQVSIPSVFEDSTCSGNVNSDCSFLALSLEDEDDETLMETLVTINEKLERVRVGPDCLSKVFDNILKVFEKDNCRKPKKQKLDWDEVEQPSKESYMHRSAEAAKVACQKALTMEEEGSIFNGILPWCSVILFPSLEAVDLQMEIKGIMAQDHVTRALGFCFDHPLVIRIEFGSCTWSEKEAISVGNVSVKQSPTQVLPQKVVDELDERIKDAITKSWSSKMKLYGPHVLVPECVKAFFQKCQIGPDGLLTVMGRIAESGNVFVQLLLFLGSWLKNLRNWCVVCKTPLPVFSRLWYCDAELCLYRFEELGIGASVLQELQNSELIDLELSLAAAATRSTTRDVFEPYPAFLLKKEEVRRRSGFFSSYMTGGNPVSLNSTSNNTGNYLTNKNLELLRQLIDSFPPLSEMQQCSNEIELVVKLGLSWLKKDGNSGSIKESDLSQEQYAEKIWLPYKILRYVLFTNRLSLCLLQESHILNVHRTLYQFAVFYNSESEQNFEQRRATEGSVFAFHGSNISNWYSIIRNGLRSLSKTRYMSAGMAHGEGIYFSTNMSYSLSYSSSFPWTIHGKTKEYSVMALCEIFSGKNYSSAQVSNFLVVPPQNEKDVVIRYLLVFDKKDRSTGCTGMASVTGGNILSETTNLHEHYDQLRNQYIQEVFYGGLIPNNQHLDFFKKRRQTAELLETPRSF